MVNSKAVENCGIQVVNVCRVLDDIVTEIVCFSINGAWFYTSACHPDGEAAWMVIPSVVFPGQFALTIDGPSKFPSPDDQGVLKQASILQILNKRPAGLVDITALIRQVSCYISVLIPAAVENLYEPNIPFHHPAGQQATGGKGSRFLDIGTIHLEHAFGFIRSVGQIRD